MAPGGSTGERSLCSRTLTVLSVVHVRVQLYVYTYCTGSRVNIFYGKYLFSKVRKYNYVYTCTLYTYSNNLSYFRMIHKPMNRVHVHIFFE